MSIECIQHEIASTSIRAIVMTSIDMASIGLHCQREYPLESCGLLVGGRDGSQVNVRRVVAGRNMADGDRLRRYQIDWHTLFNTIRQARDSGEAIVGFYHSHPDCEPAPSLADRTAAWLDHVYLIVPVKHGVAEQAAAWCVCETNGTLESVVIVQHQ